MRIGEGQQSYSVKTAEFIERKNSLERMQQAVRKTTEQRQEVAGDTLELSEEGKFFAVSGKSDDDGLSVESDMPNSMGAEETNDPMKESVKETSKCMEIARRIAAGGKVPASDAQRLMQYNPQLYMSSVNAAATKQSEKKQYEAMFEDEKKTENGQHKDKTFELSDDMKEKVKDLDSLTTEGTTDVTLS